MKNEGYSPTWPLLFSYRGPVFGNGFLAHVDMCGKLLARVETEGIWFDGVNPGAFAVGAPTLEAASRIVTEALTKVLIDFAESADSFLSFKTTAERFYNQTDADTVGEWDWAVEAVKQGVMPIPAGLPRTPSGWQCGIQIVEKTLEEITPHDNAPVSDTRQLAAAA
jgi:hypothetical protein